MPRWLNNCGRFGVWTLRNGCGVSAADASAADASGLDVDLGIKVDVGMGRNSVFPKG
jgi:hypothetical protein